jgi:hypothetical protein
MEPSDLTVRILSDVRDELRGLNTRLDSLARENASRFAEIHARFEVVESTLRDLAQQLVVLGPGVKVAI